mmetsp:Transcript_54479/g.126834  ORF Transcript_54479/g.126834 Transcript_54479/m.126834 type:complete len:213 (+) Transcript_54479:438-1076(+)
MTSSSDSSWPAGLLCAGAAEALSGFLSFLMNRGLPSGPAISTHASGLSIISISSCMRIGFEVISFNRARQLKKSSFSSVIQLWIISLTPSRKSCPHSLSSWPGMKTNGKMGSPSICKPSFMPLVVRLIMAEIPISQSSWLGMSAFELAFWPAAAPPTCGLTALFFQAKEPPPPPPPPPPRPPRPPRPRLPPRLLPYKGGMPLLAHAACTAIS